MTRVVFMGSPNFALPSLSGLASKYEVVGIVTQPDRPAGRGRRSLPRRQSKGWLWNWVCRSFNLSACASQRLSNNCAVWVPDVIVVAAFGQILRPEVLDLPRHGCISVHASLLPRSSAGAADRSCNLGRRHRNRHHHHAHGCGSGHETISPGAIPIAPDDTAGSLSAKLALLGDRVAAGKAPGLSFRQTAAKAPAGNGCDYRADARKIRRRVGFFTKCCPRWSAKCAPSIPGQALLLHGRAIRLR